MTKPEKYIASSYSPNGHFEGLDTFSKRADAKAFVDRAVARGSTGKLTTQDDLGRKVKEQIYRPKRRRA